MTTVVFYVLPRLPSMVAIFVLGGVFSAQALLDCLYLKWSPCTAWRHGYTDVDEHRPPEEKGWAKVLENKLSRLVALVLQFFSAVTLAVIAALQCVPKDRFLVGFGTALSLLVLATVWSSKVQQESHRARKMAERTKGSNIIRERERALPSARFKSSKQYHLLLLPCLHSPHPSPFLPHHSHSYTFSPTLLVVWTVSYVYVHAECSDVAHAILGWGYQPAIH